MLSLIPITLALGLASAGTPLNLVPYAYLSSPIPVYQQFQNTRTGEHAFSYAGGPSAQEEVKGADGVLRGSYSYVDANGILQSVFYVADDNGFRVAATNLPSDSNVQIEPARVDSTEVEPTHIILARDAAKSRRRRSILEDTVKTAEQTQEGSVSVSPKDESSIEKDENVAATKALIPSAVLLDRPSVIPLATSHQSQVQVHSNARLDLTEREVKPVDLQPILPVQTILGGLPVLARAPTYHENRVQLHKNLGIEGATPKDAVKIDVEPLTLVRSQAFPVPSTIVAKHGLPLIPVIAKEAVPVLPATQIGIGSVTTSVSSHGISQIHGPSGEALRTSGVIAKESTPVALENEALAVVPLVKDSSNVAAATVTASISSHGISQIHGDSRLKIAPALFYRTVPIAHLHPVIEVPVSALG